jgi:TPR repeat protein
MENATKPSNSPLSSFGGPSVLGLDQPGGNQPSTDALRERAFSGLDSFFEPEQPKTSGRRILLMVALLAALGGAAWWTYTNYLGATEGRKPEPATSNAGEASAEKPSTQAGIQDAAPAAGSPQAAVPSAAVPSAAVPGGRVPESQTENASAGPDATRKTADAEAKPAAEAKPMTPAPVAQPKTPPAEKRAATREPGVASAKASNSPTPATADTGDPDFRKGEAYLYGRGAQENCNDAVKYLKAASAKSNAKARSAFGTMYATGHCVQRDLPTSYLWFALALRVDPNNQILEKDLNAVWNQMTPPERQMATRMKQ